MPAVPEYPAAAATYDHGMRALSLLALRLGRHAWRGLALADLDASWTAVAPTLITGMTALQLRAATAGAAYGASTIAEQGFYEPPQAFVDPRGFAGTAPDGRSLDELMRSPVTQVKTAIGAGVAEAAALRFGARRLDRIVQTVVSDTGRVAAGVDVTARRNVYFVRMLEPPSCPRCVVLAGRVYRWNEGFLRHPKCDCRHIPAREDTAGDRRTDPYAYFESLSEAEQAKAFGKANAQAIRDGADVSQVVNTQRGLSYAGISSDGTRRGQRAGAMTTEGTTRRGAFGRSAEAQRTRGRRMTPEAIYRLNGGDRAAALRDLERYGYILPGGQKPLGSIVGQRQGYGQLGHGGAYSAARKRIEDAIANGRDPAVRATMTAAERRLFDAKARWELVQQGVNPFGNPALSPREAASAGPLTPQIAAGVENHYRKMLASGGQIFTR